MTTVSAPPVDASDPLQTAADPLAFAREHIATTALRDSNVGRVGLELEFHLVDLARPGRRPTWDDVLTLTAGLPPMPSGSSVTFEPGGQIELSTPPTDGVAASVAALAADRAVLISALAAAGYGAAGLGTDPARPVRRINPSARYVAMEQHFFAVGCAVPGRTMMSSTAALQVNLDAGPEAGWSRRLGLVRDLGPVLVAVSACSPLLAGRASGWHSMRQEVWHGIDRQRSSVVRGADPAAAWAEYALAAPVMLVPSLPSSQNAQDRPVSPVVPVTRRVPLSAWLGDPAIFGRAATLADLDYHLTTLFPPVRPRGYVEIRCLDSLPDRWWPALAALTATLVDDDLAADRAAELCEPVRDDWLAAARYGLGAAAVHRAAYGCVEVAARRCPPQLRPDVEALAELVASGRSPGDELRERAAVSSPLAVLEAEARA